MPEPFLISKAVDFSFPAVAKSTSLVAKGLLVIGLIAWGAYSGYITLIKPHFNPTPTTTQYQNAESITNNEYIYTERRGLVDFKLWIFRISIFEKDSKPKIKKVVEDVEPGKVRD